MLPSIYGCSSQQSSTPPPPAPSIAISAVTFTTLSYGTTLEATPTGIPLNDKITTILNAGNSFTVPTDGLAQYYSNSNTSQQVFHMMEVAYTPTNWAETDLPTDGNCQFGFETTMNEAPAASQLSTWPLEGNVEGGFLPNSAKVDGVRITTQDELERSDVFLLSPILGEEAFPLLNGVQVLVGGEPAEQNNTDRLNKIIFAAQNLGSSSSFDLVVSVLLGDGSYVTSPAQTITIPSGAVKTNLVGGIGINSFTTTTEAYGVQLPGGTEPPITAITTPSQILVSALNTGNSFTTPELAPNVGMAQGYNDPDDPAEQVLHSFVINIDTSALTLSDYPATNLIVEYLFSWNADSTNIGPSSGILWSGELGQAQSSTNVGSIFTTSGANELDSINTNAVIPFASVDLPREGDSNRDYNASWKAYAVLAGNPVDAPYTVNLKVRIQKTDGSFTESAEVPLNITANGVLPVIIS
tara:strand:- start:31097 stop:32500 length:1404 start_codon:yes stop_codon:yes gene_type:complete